MWATRSPRAARWGRWRPNGSETGFEGYIAKGIADGATLATGGGRPKDLERGWYIEPTVFGNVDNQSVIAQEEIFGPVLSVIPAADEDDAVRIANDTIYGLNASVFTSDVNRARQVGGRLRSGTVGHNAMRTDFGVSFGGFKQSGIGREGVHEGLPHFLETKFMVLEGTRKATRTPSSSASMAAARVLGNVGLRRPSIALPSASATASSWIDRSIWLDV